MIENYNYPDTHEMLELHDILEELLSKGEYAWEIKRHFLDLVAKKKGLLMST